jgi:hypothetical protein
VAGSCEHGNEPSVSIKSVEFIDHLNDFKLLKKDAASRSYVIQIELLEHGSGTVYLSVCQSNDEDTSQFRVYVKKVGHGYFRNSNILVSLSPR